MKNSKHITMLAHWSNKWVAELINDKVLPAANELLENPVFTTILEKWNESNAKYETRRAMAIAKAIETGTKFEEDVLLKGEKEKVSRYSETMYDIIIEMAKNKKGGKKEDEGHL